MKSSISRQLMSHLSGLFLFHTVHLWFSLELVDWGLSDKLHDFQSVRCLYCSRYTTRCPVILNLRVAVGHALQGGHLLKDLLPGRISSESLWPQNYVLS